MTTDTKENTSALEALDFDLPCFYNDKTATWIGISTCCNTSFFFCEECKIRTEKSHLEGFRKINYRCHTCKSYDLDIDWNPL